MQTLVTAERRAKSKLKKALYVNPSLSPFTKGGVGGVTLCLLLLALCPLMIFSHGCGPKPYVRPQTDVSKIRRIAVLPLENFTSDEYASEKMRRIVISELLSCNRDVIEPGEVARLLRESKIKSLGSMKTSEVQDIGKALEVDALMMGSVEAFGIGRGVSVTYPEVTINLRLIETSSGHIIWSMRNTSGGADFWSRHLGSEGMSLSEAAGKAVRESIRTLF